MSRINYLTLIIAILLVPIFALGQYNAVSCEDFGFGTMMYDEDGYSSTGVDGKEFDLFSMYKSSGQTIPDCMVYKADNNQDYVIVPTDWVTDPEKKFQTAILALFEAMEKSREEFRKYGEVNMDWYFLYGGDTPDRDAVTYNFDKECWMRSMKWLDTKRHVKYFKQTVAHEGGHCFSLESLRESPNNYRPWVEESSANYLSTLVYPKYNYEHYEATSFELDSIMRQKYDAYLLLEYYAQVYSNQDAVNLTKVILNENIDIRSRLKSMEYDRILHETYFYHYVGELPDSGGGFIPREPEVDYKGSTIVLDPGENEFSIPTFEREQLSLFQLILPEGFDLELHPPVENSERAYFSIIAGSQRFLEWDSKLEIEGNCDGDQFIDLLASHINWDDVSGTRVKYELKERTGCCDADVTVSENPDENELKGTYEFDYYIRSTVAYMSEGESETYPLYYYVNSKDGSMMFTKSWFTEMFGTTQDGDLKLDALIMLANGQLVGYVYDKEFAKRRAITMDMNQTGNDIMRARTLNSAELFRNGLRANVSPAPLPPTSKWSINTTPYSYYQPEKSDPGRRNHVTAYISNETTGIQSPMPQFGFMTGHIKDNQGRSKKLGFLQMTTDKGDWFNVQLDQIERRCASFTANGYEKFTLMGSEGAVGAMTEAERIDLVNDQDNYYATLNTLLQRLAACGDDEFCVEQVNKEILYLQKGQEDKLYDLDPDPDASGTAGTSFQIRERQIRDRIYAKEEQILEQQRRCATLSNQNTSCGGCMNYVVDRCHDQLDELKKEADQLECQMAKLHGVGDMFEDCH